MERLGLRLCGGGRLRLLCCPRHRPDSSANDTNPLRLGRVLEEASEKRRCSVELLPLPPARLLEEGCSRWRCGGGGCDSVSKQEQRVLSSDRRVHPPSRARRSMFGAQQWCVPVGGHRCSPWWALSTALRTTCGSTAWIRPSSSTNARGRPGNSEKPPCKQDQWAAPARANKRDRTKKW